MKLSDVLSCWLLDSSLYRLHSLCTLLQKQQLASSDLSISCKQLLFNLIYSWCVYIHCLLRNIGYLNSQWCFPLHRSLLFVFPSEALEWPLYIHIYYWISHMSLLISDSNCGPPTSSGLSAYSQRSASKTKYCLTSLRKIRVL